MTTIGIGARPLGLDFFWPVDPSCSNRLGRGGDSSPHWTPPRYPDDSGFATGGLHLVGAGAGRKVVIIRAGFHDCAPVTVLEDWASRNLDGPRWPNLLGNKDCL